MSGRWLVAAALLALVALGLWRLRECSPLHPLSLALAATGTIGVFFPLVTTAVAPVTWRNVLDPPEAVVLGAEVQFLAFAAGLVLAAFGAAAREPRPREDEHGSARTRFRDRFVACSLLGVGALLYLLYVRRLGIAVLADREDPAAKYLASSGLGTLALGLDLMILAVLWAEGGRVGRGMRTAFRLVALAIGAWAIGVLSVRTYAMALGLGFAHLFCRRRGMRLAGTPPALVLALVAGYLGVEGYSIVRGLWRDGLLEALQLVQAQAGSASFLGKWVGGSELAHPFVTTLEVMRDEEAGALGGESYGDALAILMPLALAPDRPQSLAQSFAAEYYPEVAARGGGTAFSLVGEAWWNLGSLGPLLVGWLVGSLLAGLADRSARRPDGAAARLLPWVSYAVVLMHRGCASSLLKQALPLVLACLVACAAARLLWGALATPLRPRPPLRRLDEPRSAV